MRIKVTKETVAITEYSCINEGEVCVNTCYFDLPQCFEGLSVTAAFNNVPIPIKNGACNIPSLKKGTVTVGVYAYTEDESGITLMYSPKPTLFYVNSGSYSDEIGVEETPTISQFEQFCKSFSEELMQITAPEGAERLGNKVSNLIDVELNDSVYPTANAVKKYSDEMLVRYGETVKSAYQTKLNKQNVVDESSTDEQYPSAKAVYDAVKDKQEKLISGENIKTINGESLLGNGDIVVKGESGVAVGGGVNSDFAAAVTEAIGEKTSYELMSAAVTDGAYINKNNGETLNATSGQKTEAIDVAVGEKYKVTGCYGFYGCLIAAYDSEGAYIQSSSVYSDESNNIRAIDYEYTVPEGVAQIICSTRMNVAANKTQGLDVAVKKEVTELNSVQELIGTSVDGIEEKVSYSVSNVCPNGNFEDASNWSALNTGTTFSIENNTATATNIADASLGQVGISQNLDRTILPQVEDDVWFISAKIKVPKGCNRIQLTLNNVDGFEYIYLNTDVKIHDGYITMSGVKRFAQSANSGTTLGISASFAKTRYPDFSCKIKEVTVIKNIDSSYTDEEIKNIYSAILEQNGGYIGGTVNVVGVKGFLDKLSYEYQNKSTVTSDKVVTVGENGDFPTVNQALMYLSKFYPAYSDGGIECEIKILDGTVINEQIRVEKIDLSYISLTTDNADNTVKVDVTGWSGITHDTRGNKPFFSGEHGARLPCIKCLFSCIVPDGGWIPSKYTDDSGNEIESNIVVGYFCNRGSMGVIAGEAIYSGSEAGGLENVGFENFYDNIIANNNSEIVLREAIARNAGRYGVMARHISRVSARSADITGCGETGAYADRSSMLDVRFANVSNSKNGLQCFNTSNMTAVETIANNITDVVADSREGSVLNCAEMTIDSAKDVFKVLNGGTVIARKTSPANVTGTLYSKDINAVDVNGVIYA